MDNAASNTASFADTIAKNGPPDVTIVFSFIAIAAAIYGIFIQNTAQYFTNLGQVPDIQGAFLGGAADGTYEVGKALHQKIRQHYRDVGYSLIRLANLTLATSVVAGVLAGVTSNYVVAGMCAVLWVIFIMFVVRTRRGIIPEIRKRESALQVEIGAYNKSCWDELVQKVGTATANQWHTPTDALVLVEGTLINKPFG